MITKWPGSKAQAHTQNTLISHVETYMPLLLYNKGFEYRGLTMTPGQLFTALRVCITLYTFFKFISPLRLFVAFCEQNCGDIILSY